MNKAKAHHGQAQDVQKPSSRSVRRNLLISVVVLILLLSLAVLFIPMLDGPNMHRNAREADAVGKLHRITTLQNDYAASHPAQGFACQLPLLKRATPTKDEYDPDAFLLSGDHAGYRIALTECEPEAGGVVTRYRVTAVPLEPGKSGVRAFCTDQTGVLWYDANGSVENCVALHRTIN